MEVRVCLVRSRILVGFSYSCSRAEVVYLSGYFELVVVSRLFGTKNLSKVFLCHNLVKMLVSPFNEGHYHRHQRMSRSGERIFHSRWNDRVDFTMDEVALLKAFQCCRKHFGRTIGYQSLKFIKTKNSSLTGMQ